MDPIPTSIVRNFRDTRSLVSINREKIDVNTIHGIIVDFDADWLLVQHVFDFFFDGWVLLRRCDISALQSTTTDVFQKALMEEEGSWGEIDFTARIPQGGISELLAEFPKNHVIVIEEETHEEDIFYIGFMKRIEDSNVHLAFFSGAGRFDDQESIIAVEDVTSISYDSNYTLHYQRYFERQRNQIDEQDGGGNSAALRASP